MLVSHSPKSISAEIVPYFFLVYFFKLIFKKHHEYVKSSLTFPLIGKKKRKKNLRVWGGECGQGVS